MLDIMKQKMKEFAEVKSNFEEEMIRKFIPEGEDPVQYLKDREPQFREFLDRPGEKQLWIDGRHLGTFIGHCEYVKGKGLELRTQFTMTPEGYLQQQRST